MERGIELLSPAGNEAALKAAVQSGANAVYIGGQEFNARHSADNFTLEKIEECARYCHLYGVDLHVAVNTLIKERELPSLIEYACRLNDAGADALIIQDIGAAELIKKACPDIALHASTQMTVTSIEGVRFLESMGFSRVVLARELSKQEIENIVKNTNAEIEVFVHGALCMCYSGQCLMSSILGGRSANRGRCAQPCRLPYTLTDKNNKTGNQAYILSPKDLALIDELRELRKIGVSSLKIEGRLKRAEYVSAVTGIYRKYLDCDDKVSASDREELKNAFSRSGFTSGYFNSALGSDMMSHKTPGNSSENKFSADAQARAKENANIRKIPITIYATAKENEEISITLTDNDYNSVTARGTVKAEAALKTPLNAERLTAQLEKLGDTPFVAENIFTELDEGIIIPVKDINAARREACEALIKKRSIREKKRRIKTDINTENKKEYPKEAILTAECETAAQAKVCAEEGIKIIYLPSEEAKKLKDISAKIVIRTDDIFSKQNIEYDSVMVSSPASAEYYKGKKLYGSHRLNIYNSVSADRFSDMELVTISPELSIGETRAVIKNTSAKTELIAYGRLTLMLMKNCPIKAMGKCANHKNGYFLHDRKNEKFPLLCTPSCTARLINSKPIFTADKLRDLLLLNPDALRLIFTVEDESQIRRVIRLYKAAINGENVLNPFKNGEFTRGHYYRGVD